jgi:prepilin-type N-terminal cleavage/methylation domain-containing protein
MHRGTPAHDRAVDAVGWQTRSGSKSGFTLVELLVVLVIIGMLASMVSFAMFRSMQAARQAKTQALISKLHNVIARHWDTFETGQPPSGMTVAELMADEMPCTQAEFSGSTLFTNTLALSVSETNDDAQCLYQLVLQIADDDLDRINLFSEDETKDISDPKDGTPDYFVDAWGQPICFIREPSGFSDSDINDAAADNLLTGGTGLYFPLIYSWGPDKTPGLSSTGAASGNGNDHLDNIHNHRMNARLQ